MKYKAGPIDDRLTSRETTKPLGKKNEAYDADSSMGGNMVHKMLSMCIYYELIKRH